MRLWHVMYQPGPFSFPWPNPLFFIASRICVGRVRYTRVVNFIWVSFVRANVGRLDMIWEEKVVIMAKRHHGRDPVAEAVLRLVAPRAWIRIWIRLKHQIRIQIRISPPPLQNPGPFSIINLHRSSRSVWNPKNSDFEANLLDLLDFNYIWNLLLN